MIVADVDELEEDLAEADERMEAGNLTLTPQAAVQHLIKKWPGGIIYVEYGTINTYTPEQQVVIRNALTYIADKTDISFQPRTSGDRIAFVDGQGCSSVVGLVEDNRFQPVYVGAQCIAGDPRNIAGVVHELSHAAGLIHEHQRSDRNDGRVRIDPVETNLTTLGMQQIAQTLTVSPVYRSAYDYRSIMQYTRRQPAKFVKNTSINAFNTPGYPGDLGPVYAFSPSDITVLNALYP